MDSQTTLILLKPDAIGARRIGALLARFESAGFWIRGLKMLQLTDAVLEEHYEHVKEFAFYPRLLTFMQSSPVVAVALSGPEVISQIRLLLGATDPAKAAAGTIRGEFGKDATINVCHASDSPQTAAEEIARFFAPEELFSYSPQGE